MFQSRGPSQHQDQGQETADIFKLFETYRRVKNQNQGSYPTIYHENHAGARSVSESDNGRHLRLRLALLGRRIPGYPLVKFQTGGIVCLDRMEKNGPWHIQWALMPEMV